MDNQTSLKYIGYARKSSEDNKERQAASLPEQLYILEGLKSRHDLHVIEVLEESRSAHAKGRPIFESMINRIEEGEVNAIITWHPNRLARNMTDGGRIIDLFDMGKLLEVRTPSRTYHNTPEDKFMLTLEFGLSKKDSDDKAIVVKRGLDKKCRDGWRPGVAPQGYLNDKGTESGFRRILTDPKRLPFVQKMFELFRKGTPVTEIHRLAEKEWGYRTQQRKRSGGRPMSISNIYKILGNPFYTGRFEYPEGSGEWHEGRHEPAISDELFEEVQVILGHKSKYHLKNHEWAYTSLLKCGFCGSTITAEEKWQCICSTCKLKFSLTKKNEETCPQCKTRIDQMKEPKILHYIYDRCKRRKGIQCSQKGIRLDLFEKQIEAEILSLEIPQCFVDWAIRQINAMNDGERDFREEAIQSVTRTQSDARTRLDNLVKLKISPGNSDGSMLSDEQYKKEKLELEAEIKGLGKQMGSIDERMLQAADEINEKFNFAAHARERFAEPDLAVKREILSKLGSHLKLQDKTLRIESPLPFMVIKKMKSEAPILQELLAPDKQSLPITKTDAMFASVPSLLRGQEARLV
ncbi:MAG: recombinase family protein [Candidatus Gottesmanbacteria bacterium]|nr:recombinase family protein [Candidatus Gottesmanbacteria bacterium]